MSDVLNSVFGMLGKHFSVGRGSPPVGALKGVGNPPPVPHDTTTMNTQSPFLKEALAAQGASAPAGMK